VGADQGRNEAMAMNEELTPRVYREYCWFALLLLIVTVGIVGRPSAGETATHANPAGVSSALPAHQAQ
jgi:hypothetical protein